MDDFLTLCPADEIKHGDREVFGVNDHWIAVFNVDGKYYAIEDLCTHDGGDLADGELNNYEIACPRHGAKFDIRDGKVLSAPAYIDIPWYETRVENGNLQIKKPRDE